MGCLYVRKTWLFYYCFVCFLYLRGLLKIPHLRNKVGYYFWSFSMILFLTKKWRKMSLAVVLYTSGSKMLLWLQRAWSSDSNKGCQKRRCLQNVCENYHLRQFWDDGSWWCVQQPIKALEPHKASSVWGTWNKRILIKSKEKIDRKSIKYEKYTK